MCETEVQPTVPDVCRRLEIIRLLLWRHRVPDLVPLFVAPYVVEFSCRVKDGEVDAADGDEYTVAAAVSRGVVLAVDVRRDDGAQLDEHVVH